jgi:hypothetical protein
MWGRTKRRLPAAGLSEPADIDRRLRKLHEARTGFKRRQKLASRRSDPFDQQYEKCQALGALGMVHRQIQKFVTKLATF